MRISFHATTPIVLGAALALGTLQARTALADCRDLPSHADLQAQLEAVVDGADNAGLGNEMWGTIVDRDGIVCAVAFSGDALGDQWPGSRVISAQKANTANAFSLEGVYPDLPTDVGRALATGNLYGLVLEQGSLFGLQFSNPVDPAVAYQDPPQRFGQSNDPMTGKAIGGVNVFGGGLALYDEDQTLLGALGVSGDTSCTDHIIAWKVRDGLGLDNIPGGVSNTGDDNLIIATTVQANTFQHPTCLGNPNQTIADLPNDFRSARQARNRRKLRAAT
jgi:uncharacterized protein GlcG (DUF336 family)